MNAKQKLKIDMFFGGLNERYETNPLYFESLEWSVKSGRKEFNGSARLTDNKFIYNFAGKQIFYKFGELLKELSAVLINYDSAVVDYTERGLRTRIIIEERNIKLERFELNKDSIQENRLKEKEYHIDLNKASRLLYELGFTTETGKIKNDMIRKYNQTDRFLELIGDLFVSENHYNIVDCACGKSYLSFILNYYLWEEKHIKADFTGIDIKSGVIEESRRIADKLGYRNMKFINEDLRTFSAVRPDAVISLHACDTATDMALGFAIRNKAKAVICVPCCHKELLDKYEKPDLEPIIKHGIFRARLNDILTDGLRCMKLEASGYKVSCVEYCSPLDTPKNLLIKAIKVSNKNTKAENEYYSMLRSLNVTPSIEYYSALSE